MCFKDKNYYAMKIRDNAVVMLCGAATSAFIMIVAVLFP